MEKLEAYRQYIQNVLTDYAKLRTSPNQENELEMQKIFDTVNDHYQLIFVGWNKGKRVYRDCAAFGYQKWQNLDSMEWYRR